MNKNELRIGNYYESVKFRLPVKLDITDFYELYHRADGADIDEEIIDDYISPIPLTEEWLKKFGFVQIENSSQVAMYKGNFGIEKNGEDWNWQYRVPRIENGRRVTCFYPHPTPIKFVHTLQNLYFSLCDDELILK